MLPDGWTIARVIAVAEGSAELVSIDVLAIVDVCEPGANKLTIIGTSPLAPSCIIMFGDLYLVQDSDDGCWYMGTAGDDGVVHCWAAYGDDLEEAIKAL